jgi:lipoate-protein ligase A
VQTHRPPDQHAPGPLCFRHFTAGDLLIDSAKVVGSAQRRQRGAILQHGGILLAQSPFAPELPGIGELTGRPLDIEETATALQAAFVRETGLELVAAGWTSNEESRIEELVNEKYSRSEWNDKR